MTKIKTLDGVYQLAEKLADEAYGDKGVYLYSERQDLTLRFNEILEPLFEFTQPKNVRAIKTPEELIDENFKGLIDLIQDEDLTHHYKGVIRECIVFYHEQFIENKESNK